MSTLELDIDFSERGESAAFVLEGWGEQEPEHRWAVGHESRLKLRVARPGQAHVLVLDVKPWRHPPDIMTQTMMIGANGRLLATIGISSETVLALAVPAALCACGELVISIGHLEHERVRRFGTYRDGRALGLLTKSVRLFAADARAPRPNAVLPPLPGDTGDGSLQAAIARRTGQPVASVLGQFESLGHRCHFGAFQRRFGASVLGLLAFAGLSTPVLVRNLVEGFAALACPGKIDAYIEADPNGFYRLYDNGAQIWYNTSERIDRYTPAQVEAGAMRRLPFLRRKFIEDLETGEKMFVLHSAYPLTAAEALAVFTALDLQGRNTLVWTNQDGPLAPGTVQRQAPGLLYGQLDRAGDDGDPSDAAWLNVAANAFLLGRGISGA